MAADGMDGDAVGGVADKDLADQVHAFPAQVQVGRKFILHAHDPLRRHKIL